MIKKLAITSTLLAALVGLGHFTTSASDRSNDPNVAMLDDCNPTDPGWSPTGGCGLKPKDGDVTMGEFGALLFSQLGPGILIGHPSWRNEPSHLVVTSRKTVRVRNRGGRGHTFTKVAEFGGGYVSPLNGALTQAQECTPQQTQLVPPGGDSEVTGLAPGLNRFQCCIHPWMRATIRVE